MCVNEPLTFFTFVKIANEKRTFDAGNAWPSASEDNDLLGSISPSFNEQPFRTKDLRAAFL